ncbi:MAG TPA: hypothetical protein VGN37_27120 [Actinocatenispora sp.]
MAAFNRALFIALAVLLVAIGAAGTLASIGRLPRVDSSTALLPPGVRNQWHDWGTAAWLILAAAGLVVAVLAFLLIRAQLLPRSGQPLPDLLRTDPAPDRPDGPAPGRTRVRTTALVHGIQRDLTRHPKVRRASIHLGGDEANPHLRARLELGDRCDVDQLQSYLTESLARFTATSGLDPTVVHVLLVPTSRAHARVR